VATSVTTYILYAYDKAKAKAGGQRIRENTLHWLALMGGWPGAIFAQKIHRHKTYKQPFRTVFWTTVILNCAALIYSLTPAGARLILTWLGQIGLI